MTIEALAEIPVDSLIASLPKADLHIHQEEVARLERVVARQQKRPPFDWREPVKRLITDMPPGEDRLIGLYKPDTDFDLKHIPDDDPEYILAKIADALEESAIDGAILVEMRFGTGGLAFMHPAFMGLFRQAEQKVKEQYPRLCAEAIGFLNLRNS